MDNQDIAIRTAFDEYMAGLELPAYAVPFEASPSFPMIRYAKGVTVVSGKKPTKYTGWHIGVEQSAELDALFEGMGVPMVRVKHLSGNEESYWQLDSIKGYILCRAVPTEYSLGQWKQSGTCHVWNEHKETYGHGSQLQCLFFMRGLLEMGYEHPLVLSFSRTVTEHFIKLVLRRQEALLEAVKRAMRKQGKIANLAFYAYWVELLKSEEEVATKGGGSYFPPVTTITPPLTVQYLKEHQALPEHLEIIESFLPSWDTWAETTSKLLLEPPRDNEAVPAQEREGAEPLKQAEKPEKDPTIIIAKSAGKSTEALYNAVWQSRQRASEGGLVSNDLEWFALLEDIAITEFATGRDVGRLNARISELLKEIAAS